MYPVVNIYLLNVDYVSCFYGINSKSLPKPDFVLIVEYPSYEAARNTFSNEEYKAILPLRDIAFKEVKILLTR